MKLTVVFLLSLILVQCKGDQKHAKKDNASVSSKVPFLSKSESKSKDTILLVLMSFNETYLLEALKTKVRGFYKTPIKQITLDLPKEAYYKARNRFRADSILHYLERANKGKYRFIAGLTSVDISTTNKNIKDWGVMGLGSLNAGSCITSTFRLKKPFSKQLLLIRLQKVVLHEIGHNHGLKHCTTNLPCFMVAADGKIGTLDKEPMDMCKVCRAKAKL